MPNRGDERSARASHRRSCPARSLCPGTGSRGAGSRGAGTGGTGPRAGGRGAGPSHPLRRSPELRGRPCACPGHRPHRRACCRSCHGAFRGGRGGDVGRFGGRGGDGRDGGEDRAHEAVPPGGGRQVVERLADVSRGGERGISGGLRQQDVPGWRGRFSRCRKRVVRRGERFSIEQGGRECQPPAPPVGRPEAQGLGGDSAKVRA